MRLIRCRAENFGSFKEVEFTFTNQGLILISGATGSGKSTLQNIPLWALYGITAKNGTAVEVVQWGSELAAVVTLEISLNDKKLTIVRSRGSKPSQNDLYWQEEDSDSFHRGKDLVDTQKLLESLLGASQEVFLAAASYNEFSPTSTFFVDKAKDRRELFEKIADLSFPSLLSEKAALAKGEGKKALRKLEDELNKALGSEKTLKDQIQWNTRSLAQWEENHQVLLADYKLKSDNFDVYMESKVTLLKEKADKFEKSRLDSLNQVQKEIKSLEDKIWSADSSKCKTCGHTKDPIDQMKKDLSREVKYKRTLIDQQNPVDDQIAALDKETNIFEDLLKVEAEEKNPFFLGLQVAEINLETCSSQIVKLKQDLEIKQYELSSLYQLDDMILELRSKLLKSSIQRIETETNRYLEQYFDSQIVASFVSDGADNIEVNLRKDSNDCTFRQLSKGQRTLLKLCFAVSVMNASANKAGTHFDTLFFDEAVDGLDDDLKIKAFRLFSELSKTHETILVIDHSEALKSCFDRKFHIELNTRGSQIVNED